MGVLPMLQHRSFEGPLSPEIVKITENYKNIKVCTLDVDSKKWGSPIRFQTSILIAHSNLTGKPQNTVSILIKFSE